MGVTVTFTGGANRPDQPHPSVMAALEAAANASLPSGSTVTVYSGTGEYGSSRHRGSTGYLGQTKFGLAADVNVSLPGGKKATAAEMKALGQAWASLTKGGVGYGKNYMGVDNIHLDLVTQDMLGPKQGMTWGGGTTGWDLADYREGRKSLPGVSRSMLAEADVPVPANKPEMKMAALAAAEQPQGLLSSLFSQPTAAARDFSGVTSDELAQALAPNANIAPSGILAESLAPAPSQDVQTAMLASLPGALPAAPVSPVSTASLTPVTQYPSLPAAPVQEVTSAPLRDVPANAFSAPVGPVERGLLADLPSALNAAPVGAVERGGMLAPAQERSFTGNPNLSEVGQFASPDEDLARYGLNPDVVPTGPAPMDFAINNNPTGNMGLLGLDKVAATPSVNEALMGPTSGPQNGRPNNAPTQDVYTGNYALVDKLGFDPFANPMGAPLGSVQTPVTPDQNFGLLASTPSSLPALSQPQEVSQYTVASVQPAPTQQSIEQARTSLDVTDEEYASQLRAAGLSTTEIQMALQSRLRPDNYVRTPVTAPPATTPTVATPSMGTTGSVSQPTYSMPSAMDVWNGMATKGIATDGTTVSRNPDGTVTRTNTYGVTETYNPSTQGWLPGGPKTQGFELPSKERAVQLGKETLGPMAGGLLGSALLGPVGGILGAVVARNMAQGKGVLGTGLMSPNSTAAQNQIAKTFGYSGATPGQGDPMSRGYAPDAHDSIARGETVGLF